MTTCRELLKRLLGKYDAVGGQCRWCGGGMLELLCGLDTCAGKDARAFLAQPEEAREAVLVTALKECQQLAIDRIRTVDEAVKKDVYAADALMGIATLSRRALADTSPAALLAQGERVAELEKALARFGPLLREGLHGRQICAYCEAGGEIAEEIRHYAHCVQVAGATALASPTQGETCKRCQGEGEIAYGDTSLGRGGMAGQTVTSGPCPDCTQGDKE